MQNHSSIRLAAALVTGVLAIVLAGCSRAPADEDAGAAERGGRSEAGVLVWQDDAEPVEVRFDAPPPPPVDAGVEVEHPMGVVFRVGQVRFEPLSVAIDVNVVNRHPEATPVRLGASSILESSRLTLVDDAGREYYISTEQDDTALEVPGGETLDATLTFVGAVPPEAKTLTLTFNDGLDADLDVRTWARPLQAIDLPVPQREDPDRVGPSVAHTNRTALAATGVVFGVDTITVDVLAAQRRRATDRPVDVNSFGLELVDDVGNVYPEVPGDQDTLVVPPASLVAGSLVFAGPVASEAKTLTLKANVGLADSFVGEDWYTHIPYLELGPLPVPEAARQPGAAPLVRGEDGHVLRLRSLRVGDGAVVARVEGLNPTPHGVDFAWTGAWLEDDRGGRLEWAPPQDNERLEVPAFSRLAATLVFPGAPTDGADSVDVIFNEDASSDPELRLAGVPLPDGWKASQGQPPASRVKVARAAGSWLQAGEALVTSAERVREILADFDAEAVDEGILVTFPDNVLFAFDSAELSGEGLELLAEMAEVIAYYEQAKVRVYGHTDDVGSQAYNQRLSERRAQAVADHLVRRHGVQEARLSTEGFGADRPVAANRHADGSDNPQGRAANRRVEVLVVTDDRSLVD